MSRPLAEWSEDDKRAAIAQAWTDPPPRAAELDDMAAWLEAAYIAEPWPRAPIE